jgi:3-isopropylmalate/(R)-2-methylmalate dehydratase small subunit
MALESILRGKAWVFGDYIDTYKILPKDYWKTPAGKPNLNAEEIGKYAMQGADPQFIERTKPGEYAFFVTGKNFGGGGKSTEQPIFTIIGAGIKAVIAESCSRYFFRNAVNNGLLILVCPGITASVKTGEELELKPALGEIRNLTTGVCLQSVPLSESVLAIYDAGGLLPYTKKRIAARAAG